MPKSVVKRIGILTSGGDCAGLNAVIRAVVARAVRHYDMEVYGIMDGSMGLMTRPLQYVKLDLNIFAGDILRMGGTMLGTTNKGDPFAFPMPDGSKQDRSQDFIDGFNELGLDALIVIGGDGSQAILRKLCRKGDIPMIGIPKTIDNDVPFTESAVGFSSAIRVCVDALDHLQPTAASHHRVMICEMMGRDAGHIALHSGIAGGADVILIPEIPYTLDSVVAKLKQVHEEGRRHALVVVAEGVAMENGEMATRRMSDGQKRYGGIGDYLSEELSNRMEVESRVTVLGHVQRGGTPSASDRVLASSFGVHAVDLAARGRFGRMVAWRDRGVMDVGIDDIVAVGARQLDPHDPLVHTARGLGTYVGEI
jgi:6-phosphofructokinase 1